ncbi:MAG: HNH endonuclease [Anaeromyxobacter sp.]
MVEGSTTPEIGSEPLPGSGFVALDALAVRVAHGRGALDVAIGQKLGELMDVSGELELGYSQITDFAREVLGLKAAFVRRLVRFEQKLRKRPLLDAAVFAGEISRRKAEEILKVAIGEEEARWVAAAKVSTVRQLEAAVKEAVKEKGTAEAAAANVGSATEGVSSGGAASETAPVEDEDKEPAWLHIKRFLGVKALGCVRAVVHLARQLDEAPRTIPECLRFMAMEYLSSHPAPLDGELRGPKCTGLGRPVEPNPELRAGYEARSNAWAGLTHAEPVPAPVLEKTSPPDAYAIKAELIALVRERNELDEKLGQVCLEVKSTRAWRALQFASFQHYCDERLGLAVSTVKNRVALERKCQELPQLREAMRSGKLSYEQARLVSKLATPEDVAAKIEEAAGKTCITLQRETMAELHRQMWNSEYLDVFVTEEIDSLLAEAVQAARKAAGRWIPVADAIEAIARHCLDVWTPIVHEKMKKAHPIMVRDGGECTVAGCSRVGDDVHHIEFRSHGGDDSDENQTGMCKPHHLRGLHAGNIWVYGSAPDKLTWILGWREVAAAKEGMPWTVVQEAEVPEPAEDGDALGDTQAASDGGTAEGSGSAKAQETAQDGR